MNKGLFVLGLSLLFVICTGCPRGGKPIQQSCSARLTISSEAGVAQVSEDQLEIPAECDRYEISWTSAQAAWLVNFLGDTPCDGNATILQNGKRATCEIPDVKKLSGKFYKYVAFDDSDPSRDPQICIGKKCPTRETGLAALACLDFSHGSPQDCKSGAPSESLRVQQGEQIVFHLPDDVSVNFVGSSPCDESQQGSINSKSRYCTATHAGNDFRYTVSANSGKEYQIQVTAPGARLR